MKWIDVVQFLLVPDYPCTVQERFGVWGPGGAWVCREHPGTVPGGKAQDHGLWRAAAAEGQAEGRKRRVIVTVGGPGSTAGSRASRFELELSEALVAEAHVFNPSLDKAAKKLPEFEEFGVNVRPGWVRTLNQVP